MLKKQSVFSYATRLVLVCSGAVFLSNCATLKNVVGDARNFDIASETQAELPTGKITIYSEALTRLGYMLSIYKMGDPPIRIQTRTIADATNLSHPNVGAEIPGDITEMTKSALNRIGKYVVYIPYQPDYVVAYAQLGAKFGVTQPDFLLTGALTEFDRGLSSAGRANNMFLGFGKGDGKTNTGFDTKKTVVYSSLALDYNLMDFKTQQMIPKMQSSNAMRVSQMTTESNPSLGFYGQSFTVKFEAKTLQGRHSAVRTLVDLSVFEVIGKLANVPYWRCLPDAQPDQTVIDNMMAAYNALSAERKIAFIQVTLRKYGENVPITGKMDDATEQALIRVYYNRLPRQDSINLNVLDWEGFAPLFFNIPMPWEMFGGAQRLRPSIVNTPENPLLKNASR